jgi:hypothetical protein
MAKMKHLNDFIVWLTTSVCLFLSLSITNATIPVPTVHIMSARLHGTEHLYILYEVTSRYRYDKSMCR